MATEPLNEIIEPTGPRPWGLQPTEPEQAVQPDAATPSEEGPEGVVEGTEQGESLGASTESDVDLSPEELETTAYKKLNRRLSERGQEVKELRDMVARLQGQVEAQTRVQAPQQGATSEEARDDLPYKLDLQDDYVPQLGEEASLYGSESEIARIAAEIAERKITAAVKQITAQNEAFAQQQQAAEQEQSAGKVIAEWAEKAKSHPSFDKDAIGRIAQDTGNLYLTNPKMFLTLVEQQTGISTDSPETPRETPKPAPTQAAPRVQQAPNVTPRHNRPASGVRPVGRMDRMEAIEKAMAEQGL